MLSSTVHHSTHYSKKPFKGRRALQILSLDAANKQKNVRILQFVHRPIKQRTTQPMPQKKLFLLDGHALVYRAHYAFITRPLINSKGQNTSAITGFVRFLWDVLKNQQPTHIAVSFDLPGGTFRNEMFPEYKANREAQPEDITFALPYIKQIIEAFRIPVATVPNYEADDVIGTLAKQAEAEGFEVYMVTPDKDYAQLVSDHIYMYKPARNGNDLEVLGKAEVLEQWGIERVEQVIDVLGLQGDSVDNIPGIPGIGPKTAVKLLAEFGSVEGVLQNADKLKGKQRENVEQFAEQALLSKQLATIDTHAPIQFDAKQYEVKPMDRDVLAEIFKELEFRTLANQILGESPQKQQDQDETAKADEADGKQRNLFGESVGETPKTNFARPLPAHAIASKHIGNVPHTYHLLQTKEARTALIRLLQAAPSFCFDTETTGIDANEAELVGMSFALRPHEAYYVPLPADQAAAKAIVAEFKAIFEDENIEKIGQNIKYDIIMLKWYGVEVRGKLFDTMIAHYLYEPDLRHNMDYLSETYLSYAPVSIETLIGKGKNQLSMRDVSVERVSEYAAEDADVTLQLKSVLAPKLQEDNLAHLYNTMEEPLINVLATLEYNGVRIDKGYLDKYSIELEKDIAALEREIHKEAGLPFNIASPKQVGEVLFDRMKIPYRWGKTKTGQYSTDEAKLSELGADHPFVGKILKHRELSKLKSTYVDALPRMINPRTGRVHSSFNQALAATGRLSSNNPNLQNIPIRTEEGRRVREAFIPRSADYILLAADYSQIELRLIAEISGDAAMIEAFQKNQDIHRATAARVYGVPYKDVTAEQRRNAKTVNFSIIYGAGATNLSQQLDIPRKEAKELIEQYFAQYQGLKHYMEDTVAKARETGYVSTLMGRRRYLRDIHSRNSLIRSNAERVAINSPIQGSAADMIKVAMINIHRIFKERDFKSKMILQVHDELVFDAHRSELDTIRPIIEEQMRTAIPNLKVPILVGMDVGEHWLEAH
jgi:DNA polymerase-1